MAPVIWDPVALDDLEQIARYIERDAPVAAKRFVQRIFQRVEQLTQLLIPADFLTRIIGKSTANFSKVITDLSIAWRMKPSISLPCIMPPVSFRPTEFPNRQHVHLDR
jgi:plasmid stabilization system protein ParE